MTTALLLSVSGCTALNMLLDRDIDRRTERTAGRPLPSARIAVTEAPAFAVALSAGGLARLELAALQLGRRKYNWLHNDYRARDSIV